MASGTSNDDDNLNSPFEELGGLHPTDKENEASHVHTSFDANFIDPACVSLLDSSAENMYATVQSCAEDPVICSTGTDFLRFETLQNSQILRGGMRNEGYFDAGFLNPWDNVDCVPTESTSGGYAMDENERVANRNWPQTAASSGASMMKVDASHPGYIDGSFLTLGLGTDAECRADGRFRRREFPGTVAPQNNNVYGPPTSTNYSDPSQNLTQDFLGFQSSLGAIPRPMFNSGVLTSHCNDKESGTVNQDTLGLGQSPYPFHSSSALQHYSLFGNSGFASNLPGINPTMAVPAGYQGFPIPYSLPSNSFNTNCPFPGFPRHYDLASESANSVWPTLPPPIYQTQNDDKKERDVPFPIVSHRPKQSGNSVAHDYLGLLTPPTEGFSSHALASIPPSLGVHSVGPTPTLNPKPAQSFRNISSSDKFGLQIAKNHSIKPVTASPLPSSAFEIQLDNSAAAQSNQEIQLSRQVGVEAKNNLFRDQTCKLVIGPTSAPGAYRMPPTSAPGVYRRPPTSAPGVYRRPPTSAPGVYRMPPTSAPGVYRMPPTSAPGVYRMPPTYAPGVYRMPPTYAPGVYRMPPTSAPGVYRMPPISAPGPEESLPPQPDSWRPPSTGPGLSSLQVHQAPQTSYVTKKSSLKRTAAEPPLKVPSWGQRRKLVHVPPPQSTNHGKQGVAATPFPPVTSYAAYIKVSGFDESPKLVGEKCLICRKDLSFSPDNPTHQPTIPPAVAVLPCGHTFHDQCLQRITPTEHAKDPPCIPCVIGEN